MNNWTKTIIGKLIAPGMVGFHVWSDDERKGPGNSFSDTSGIKSWNEISTYFAKEDAGQRLEEKKASLY